MFALFNSELTGFLSFVSESACLLIKVIILIILYRSTTNSQSKRVAFYTLFAILCTGIFTNLTMTLYWLREEPFCIVSKLVSRTFFRLEFATHAVQFLALFFFFRELSSRKTALKSIIAFSLPACFFVPYYLVRAIQTFYMGDLQYSSMDELVRRFFSAHLLILGFFLLLLLYRNYKREQIKLLRHHNLTLGLYFMLPYYIAKIFESSLMSFFVNVHAATITSILLTGMIVYCFRRLAGLRFLNMKSHINATIARKISFLDEFKEVLHMFSSMMRLEEAIDVTRSFFKRAFNVPTDKLSVFLRDLNTYRPRQIGDPVELARKLYIETVLGPGSEHADVISFIEKHHIIIRDEVEFSHYYQVVGQEKRELAAVIEFLGHINADVFLPVYCDERIVAYIVITHGVRPSDFYTDVERDEMLIYCSHLGSVLSLLSTIDMETYLARERQLQQSLDGEMRARLLLYKSVNVCARASKTSDVGVIVYKNRRFAYCNQAASDVLKVDLNEHKTLPIVRQIQEMCHETALYHTPKQALIANVQGETIAVHTTNNIERSNVIATVRYPGVVDYIKNGLSILQDPAYWDTLLALYTTEEGTFVNNLLPTDTATLLNCKVNLLRTALAHSTFLIELAEDDDVRSFAHVIHKIHQRSVIEEVIVRSGDDEARVGLKLFGINPVFQIPQEPCLFESLSGRGTILIQNVHQLSLQLQRRLYEYIISGRYTPLKSEQQLESDVLLLVATSYNVQDLVQRGLFLKELYAELRNRIIWMPSLTSLPADEFFALLEGIRKQLVHSKAYQNLLTLTESESRRLMGSGCVSLHELKQKVQGVLQRKTRKRPLEEHAVIDQTYTISDLDLAEAARLGKNVLKDPKLFAMVLGKFGYNQSLAAQFLGVNRSTINRRCVQYGLDLGRENETETSGRA